MANTFPDLRGIITVLNTPFTTSGAVDHAAYGRHIAYAMDAGVSGFLAPAMAGEVDTLTDEERLGLANTMVTAAQGRVPVIGCATATTADARIRLAAELIALGCDGVLVSIPYTTEAEYARQVHAVAQIQPPFLMLQDWDAQGEGVPVPVIARLFDEVDAFQCIKVEVHNAGRKYTAIQQATDGNLQVSGGWAVTHMLEGLDRGVHAFMPTGLHRIYVEIFRQYQSGNRDTAKELFYRLLPVLVFTNQSLEMSIHFFKRLLFEQGIYQTPHLRSPELIPDDHEHRIMDELIHYAMALENKMKS